MKLVEFAKEKLLSGDLIPLWTSMLSGKSGVDLMGQGQRLRRASLAMLCSRAALTVAPASLLAVELVSGHLGVCLHAFPRTEPELAAVVLWAMNGAAPLPLNRVLSSSTPV